MTREEIIALEKTLKVGDDIIIVQCNNGAHKGQPAVVAEIDKRNLGQSHVYAIKYRLSCGLESWGRAIPATGLMKELL